MYFFLSTKVTHAHWKKEILALRMLSGSPKQPIPAQWPLAWLRKWIESVTFSLSGMWPLKLRGKLQLVDTLVPLELCVVLPGPSSRTKGPLSLAARLLVPTRDSSQRATQLRSSLWGWLRLLLRLYCCPVSPTAQSCVFLHPHSSRGLT